MAIASPATSPASLDAATRRRLADPRLTAAGLLFEAADGLRDALTEALAPSGLSAVELEVLTRLARSPEERLRMADLATQVAMSASGLTRLVDRMERDGLVRREACPTDRRGAFAVATAEGLAHITDHLDAHIDTIDRNYTGRLTGPELEALLHALRIVRDVVRPHAAAGAVADPGESAG